MKKGFSLAEALVVMVIISIFFAAAAKVFTTRPKPKKQLNIHGYYECFNSGGLHQRYIRDGVESPTVAVGVCTFEPPVGVSFFNINSFSPIPHSSFEPNVNNNLTISVGSSINISADGKSASLGNGASSEEVRIFLGTMYPESELYNGGAIRSGVIISW